MGKTPGKWIKTLLLGKKSSKSSLSKKKEISKPADKGEALVSSNEPVSDLNLERSLVPAPVPETGARNEVYSEMGTPTTLPLPNAEVSLLSAREDDNAQTTINLGSLNDPQGIRHEEAATKAQAAFRGYLACRAFRTLKGIIKLQALIRGHLVRRQAVATLSCVWGIVKLQALARGQKVRRSDIGIEAHKIYSQGKLLDAKNANASGLSLSTRVERLRKNAYIQKLLATSPTAMPLHLQYGPGEANSAEEWLERWTRSCFWEPLPQAKKSNDPKLQMKLSGGKTKQNEQSKPKRTVRKPSSANVENGPSSCSASESDKRKRNIIRKVSSHTTDPVQEPIETEKVRRNVRRTSDPRKEVSDRLEINNEKPKQNLKKASGYSALDFTEQGASTTGSAEKMKDVVVATSNQSDLEINLKPPAGNGLADELDGPSAGDVQHVENSGQTESVQVIDQELNSNDDHIDKENQKTSQRRASFPAKIDHQENGIHGTPKLPSYMAPTESAKARLRGQGSPRFAQDVVEKNGVTRRLSLPSSTNGKFSSPSPRAQRLIQVTGKGVIRSDRSLSSSRDGGSKNT